MSGFTEQESFHHWSLETVWVPDQGFSATVVEEGFPHFQLLTQWMNHTVEIVDIL